MQWYVIITKLIISPFHSLRLYYLLMKIKINKLKLFNREVPSYGYLRKHWNHSGVYSTKHAQYEMHNKITISTITSICT